MRAGPGRRDALRQCVVVNSVIINVCEWKIEKKIIKISRKKRVFINRCFIPPYVTSSLERADKLSEEERRGERYGILVQKIGTRIFGDRWPIPGLINRQTFTGARCVVTPQGVDQFGFPFAPLLPPRSCPLSLWALFGAFKREPGRISAGPRYAATDAGFTANSTSNR